MPDHTPAGAEEAASAIDTTVPHSARIWNYWLGGKDNYQVDRDAGEQFRETFPDIVDIARSSRAFITRAVTHLVREAGVSQFLDVGTGLPTQNSTHQVAQAADPSARVVYVDNDPLILTHAQALLVGSEEGATDYVHADIRDPRAILDAAAATLDLTRPVALVLVGILGHLTDSEAATVLDRLVSALPSGSYLVLSDGTTTDEANIAAQEEYNESGSVPYHLRTPEGIDRFFAGLELVEPGAVPTPFWRPDPTEVGTPRDVADRCGVARKP
ncbi:S-adenosyl methyltransferase [Haloactinospora alba]|uniref:S-adenosyl methyltransferase n=1 Tax=Haloactinospora alba TaxID=405555 RepID=A0A543NNN2_9ACTN|nr:SAM-dependent methyltransferase [Haloactinospora alba]TQN33450.1 S-adenosyl methyltransferase [Haloactinospora alba]